MKNLIVGLKGTLKNAERIISEPIEPLYEVFIAAPTEVCGNGRAGLPNTNIPLLNSLVSLVSYRNTKINVLLNSVITKPSPVLENFIDITLEMGISSYTVANDELVDFLIEKRIQENLNFDIVLSTFMYLTNLEDIQKYQESLSSNDRIIINQQSNREFYLLQQMHNKSKIPLELYANTLCIQGCKDNIKNHALFLSKNSGLKKIKDKYFNNCIQKRIDDPSEILTSPIIRPEDVPIYEGFGFNFFKLGTRTFSTEQTLKIIRAYQENSFNGDLGYLNGANNFGLTKIHSTPNKDLDGLVQELILSENKSKVYSKYQKKMGFK